MSVLTNATAAVPSGDVKSRLAEYRRIGHERQAPAHVVYHPEHHDCPWADCRFRIAGINFRLETQGTAPEQALWLAAWWSGPGLIARCPGCRRHVLFGLEDKRAVADPMHWPTAVLPDSWNANAQVVQGNA